MQMIRQVRVAVSSDPLGAMLTLHLQFSHLPMVEFGTWLGVVAGIATKMVSFSLVMRVLS